MKSTRIFLALGILLLTFGCIENGSGTLMSEPGYPGEEIAYAPAQDYNSYPDDKMVILTGDIALSVPEGTLEDKLGEVEGILDYENAEITGMDYYESTTSKTYTLTVRIDPERFDIFVDKLKEVGEIESMSTDLYDVTEEYTNLETRIDNLDRELERLYELYEIAEDIEDMLAIEREITRVTMDLEYYQQQKMNLESQVEKSTITVSITEETSAVDTNLIIPLQELANIFFGSLSFAIMLVAGLIGFTIPFAVILLILYLIIKAIRGKLKKKSVKMKKE